MHFIFHGVRRTWKANILSVTHFIAAVKTTGTLGESFPKSPNSKIQKDVSKVPLHPELLELQEAPIIPFWPTRMPRVNQDKHGAPAEKRAFGSSSSLPHPWLRTGGWGRRAKWKQNHFWFILKTLPGTLARHSRIFPFPQGICPRIPAFKRADFFFSFYQEFLEATMAV